MDKDIFWLRLMDVGAKMGCHQRADRSFYIKNYQFPLCARCTGIALSSICGYIIYLKKKPRLSIGALLTVPMMFDGIVQLAGIKESTNIRRFVTGIMGGVGLVFIRLHLYRMIIRGIKSVVVCR